MPEAARHQGAAAARTLLAGPNQAKPFDEVPNCWSDQDDVKLQTLGVTTDYDAFTIVEGADAGVVNRPA